MLYPNQGFPSSFIVALSVRVAHNTSLAQVFRRITCQIGGRSRLLTQLLAAGTPGGGSGADEYAAQFGSLLVDGLWAVTSEQLHGRLVGQFRGDDIERGREFEASFLDGLVDKVGKSGLLAGDAKPILTRSSRPQPFPHSGSIQHHFAFNTIG